MAPMQRTIMSQMSPFPANDICLGFFRDTYEAGHCVFPDGAHVLELGSAEADWLTPMKALRPDLHLTGMDQRYIGERPGADVLISADILTFCGFQDASFDAVVAISVLTWAGVGHYGDRQADGGDSTMMALARRWVKPSGWMYLDVPYSADGHMQRESVRAYSDESIQDRLLQDKWQIVHRQGFSGDGHKDGPYMAMVVKPI